MKKLTPDAVASYKEHGFYAPIPVLSAAETANAPAGARGARGGSTASSPGRCGTRATCCSPGSTT